VNGSNKDLEAYDKSDHAVVLVQYQSGALGLNLQKYNRIIYYSPVQWSELFQQSIKRIHRIGQNRTCFYYRLITKNSIETDIYMTLDKLQDYTDALFIQNFT
jgi:SNF2 family DNA or RNA helicase